VCHFWQYSAYLVPSTKAEIVRNIDQLVEIGLRRCDSLTGGEPSISECSSGAFLLARAKLFSA